MFEIITSASDLKLSCFWTERENILSIKIEFKTILNYLRIMCIFHFNAFRFSLYFIVKKFKVKKKFKLKKLILAKQILSLSLFSYLLYIL